MSVYGQTIDHFFGPPRGVLRKLCSRREIKMGNSSGIASPIPNDTTTLGGSNLLFFRTAAIILGQLSQSSQVRSYENRVQRAADHAAFFSRVTEYPKRCKRRTKFRVTWCWLSLSR